MPTQSPWDTSYIYNTPGYAAFGGGGAGASGDFYGTSRQVNDFMAGQAQNQYLRNLPNYSGMVAKRTENVGQKLRGQLPEDVIRQITQQAAERGIATGSPGSQNTNAAYLRALGLNSLQMQQAGSQELTQSIADTPVAPLFSPASMIVPNYFGAQEMGAARAGMGSGQRAGGGYSVSGMPQIGIGTQAPRASNIDIQQGLLNSATFQNGMYVGGSGGGGAASNPAQNWWNSYGGTSLNSNADFNPNPLGAWNYGAGQSPTWDQWSSGADNGQFAEEDDYFASMPAVGTIDASDPSQWGMFE